MTSLLLRKPLNQGQLERRTYLLKSSYSVCYISSIYSFVKIAFARAGALALWIWLTTHVQEVLGSKPGTVYLMDIFSH